MIRYSCPQTCNFCEQYVSVQPSASLTTMPPIIPPSNPPSTSDVPTVFPSKSPSAFPTTIPSTAPTAEPSSKPTNFCKDDLISISRSLMYLLVGGFGEMKIVVYFGVQRVQMSLSVAPMLVAHAVKMTLHIGL